MIQGSDESLGKELLFLTGGEIVGSLGIELDKLALPTVEQALADGLSQRAIISEPDETLVEIFINVILPEPVLVMVGGVHIAIALSSIAKTLGYWTVVIDPRRSFGSKARFPNVDQLIQSWPEEAFEQVMLSKSSAVAMLTHDPKIDDPSLKIALNSDAFYIGALGSNQTHTRRLKRLKGEGLTEKQLEKIHSPIGKQIGGRSPEEIALGVMAEITSVRYRKT